MGLYDDMDAAAALADEAPIRPGKSPAPLSSVPEVRLRRRICALAEGFSIEVLPKTARKIEHFAEHLPRGTRVFIPFLPGAVFADCVPLAARLRREGMEPVPHIAARRLTSADELSETLARLREEAAVTQCLVIAGDPDRAAGPFADSMALLERGELERQGIATVFAGAQPEGIPRVAPEKVEAALLWKNAYARASSAELRLVTQFTLDIHALTAWLDRLEGLDNRLPLHIGLAGPTSLTTLLKFAALTGAAASLRAMRRYGMKISQLASEAEPDAMVTYLAGRDAPLAGLHIYTFGGFERSAAWMRELGRGAFRMKPEGAGFAVEAA